MVTVPNDKTHCLNVEGINVSPSWFGENKYSSNHTNKEVRCRHEDGGQFMNPLERRLRRDVADKVHDVKIKAPNTAV